MPFVHKERSYLAEFVYSVSILLNNSLYLSNLQQNPKKKNYIRLKSDNPQHPGATCKKDFVEQSLEELLAISNLCT